MDVKRDHFDALYGLNCKTGKELQNKWESAANHTNGTVNQLGDKLYLLWKKNKADIYMLWWIPAAHMKAQAVLSLYLLTMILLTRCMLIKMFLCLGWLAVSPQL